MKAQNLIVNSGAEVGPPATNGWTVVNSGSDCSGSGIWRVEGNQNGFPAAHSGTYYFYPGCDGNFLESYELRQDINVSANAAAIDNNLYGLIFSGYTRSFNQLFADLATITLEARDGANTTVLGSYSIKYTINRNGWKFYTVTSLLPPGTRFVRIRLIGTSISGSSIDSYFDDLSLKSYSIVPVGLVQFNVVKNRGSVLLNWQTANEMSNEGFTIMRSSDQSNWSELGFIKKNQQRIHNNNYSFVDKNPPDGRNFYKLRQTGIDGRTSYSEIRTVVMNESPALKIYPNPAHDILNIQIVNAPVSLEIMDIFGKSIARYGNVKKLNISNLAKGIYILKVATLDKVITKKFLKR